MPKAAKIAHDVHQRFFASSQTTREVVQRLKQMGEELRELTSATPNALVTPTVVEGSGPAGFNFTLDRQLSTGTQQALLRRTQMQKLLVGIAELMGPQFSISAFELIQGDLVPVRSWGKGRRKVMRRGIRGEGEKEARGDIEREREVRGKGAKVVKDGRGELERKLS